MSVMAKSFIAFVPYVSVCVEKHIVRLDVSVDVSEPMDGVYGEDHLDDVEPRHVLRQAVLKLAQQGQQVPSAVVVHHEILKRNKVFEN